MSATPRDRFLPAVALAVTAVLCTASPGAGQRVVNAGDRVRVHAPGWFPGFRASFVRATADSVVIRQRQSEMAFPRGALDSIEVSIRRRSRVPEGALIGLAGGVGVGWLLGSGADLCGARVPTIPLTQNPPPEGKTCRRLLLGTFGILGLVGGVLYGIANPSDTWGPATLPGPGASGALGSLGRWRIRGGVIVRPSAPWR